MALAHLDYPVEVLGFRFDISISPYVYWDGFNQSMWASATATASAGRMHPIPAFRDPMSVTYFNQQNLQIRNAAASALLDDDDE